MIDEVLELSVVAEDATTNCLTQGLYEVRRRDHVAQNPVAQGDDRCVFLQGILERGGKGEGVLVDQVEQVEKIVAPQLDRCRRQHHHALHDWTKQPGQTMGSRFVVSQVVRLVDDQHVEQGLFEVRLVQKARQLCSGCLGGLLIVIPALGRAQTLHAGDQRELLLGAFSYALQVVEQAACIDDLRAHPEALGEFGLPLFAKHRGTDHQEALRIDTGAELRPDQAGLDGLAEADLVRNEDAVRRRVEELQYGLELVGKELRVRRVQAVDEVRQPTA